MQHLNDENVGLAIICADHWWCSQILTRLYLYVLDTLRPIHSAATIGPVALTRISTSFRLHCLRFYPPGVCYEPPDVFVIDCGQVFLCQGLTKLKPCGTRKIYPPRIIWQRTVNAEAKGIYQFWHKIEFDFVDALCSQVDQSSR